MSSSYLGSRGQRGFDAAALAKKLDAAATVIMNNIDWGVAGVHAPVKSWGDVHMQLKLMVQELASGGQIASGMSIGGGGGGGGVGQSALPGQDDPLAP